MLLQVTHQTDYEYSATVDTAQHVVHLQPKSFSCQALENFDLQITPSPAQTREHTDIFGNRRCFFAMATRHDTLTVCAKSLVKTMPNPAKRQDLEIDRPLCREVQSYFQYRKGAPWDSAAEFTFPSDYVLPAESFRRYALQSIKPDRSLLEASIELTQRIHEDMRYVSHSTDLQTTAHEAFDRREGVCQDFAHIMLCCFRSLGLPARYVSGYLLTQPPPGKPRLIGADASHAWVSVYLPRISAGGLSAGGRWIDLDPTNNRWGIESPGEDYVTLAFGRDYADVSPIRGVIHGGANHTLKVAVTVMPVSGTVSGTVPDTVPDTEAPKQPSSRS
jgi:transglutaminase-like putative cysteine protease